MTTTNDTSKTKIHQTRSEFENCRDENCRDENCTFARARQATLERSAMTNPKRDDPDVRG